MKIFRKFVCFYTCIMAEKSTIAGRGCPHLKDLKGWSFYVVRIFVFNATKYFRFTTSRRILPLDWAAFAYNVSDFLFSHARPLSYQIFKTNLV